MSTPESPAPGLSAWADPGVEEVATGVWRIPLPLPGDGLRAVNVYAISDGTGLTFVDGGWALDAARPVLVEALGQIGAGLPDIRRFLVTHIHRDHYTNAIAIRREFGSRVLLGAGERPAIEALHGPDPGGFVRQMLRLDRLGAGDLADRIRAQAPPGPQQSPRDFGFEEPDDWIASQERFEVGDRTLVAIATPGHTSGHVVFADHEAGLLFAGDHVLPHITPSVAFEINPPPLALRDYLASLKLVLGMPEMTLLPAHGPAGGSVHARVEALLAHHATRLDDMAQTLRGGWLTAYDVAQRVGWTRRNRQFAELDLYNGMLAVFETQLHLDLLVAQGIVVAKESDGVTSYGLRDGGTVA